jgi:alpha-tubulin suppressor-like RCC1 family protein
MVLSRRDCAILTCVAIIAFAGCSDHESETDPDEDAGTGTDTSSDSDTDTDTDTSTSYTAIDVSGALRHTCAVLDDGATKCWGFPLFGWLGYGYDAEGGDSSLPSTLPFVDVGGSVEQISAGGGTCALLDNGAVKCWGSVALGIPEVDAIGDDDVPADFPSLDLGGAVAQVSSGGGHVCALLQGGDVKCWGENEWGQLGNADDWHIIDASTVLPIELGGPAIDVSAGSAHTCAVLENGDVLCWGNPGSGRLGYGNAEAVGDDEVPAEVGPIDLGGPAVQVSA